MTIVLCNTYILQGLMFMNPIKSRGKKLIIVWGGYPPSIGGGEARIYRIVKYLSNVFKTDIITQKLKKTPIVDRTDNLCVFRIPPSSPKHKQKNKFQYYYHHISYLVIVTLRILFLYPFFIINFIKERPVAIIKEATTWDFPRFEKYKILKFPFLLLKPWILVSKLFKVPLYVYFTNLCAYRDYKSYLHPKLKYADSIIVVDLWMKDYLKNKYGVNKHIHYIPVSVDIHDFEKNNLEYPTKNKILFIGRLSKEKGCLTLIKSIPSILKHIQDVEVDIIGDGYDKESLENLSDELGVRKYISFYGAIDSREISAYYDGVKVLVNPLRVLGIGNVTIEAMASGVPVIKSQMEQIQNEPIIDGFNGYSFELDNYEDLANKIIRILKMHEFEWKHVSKSCRKTSAEYDIKKVTDKLIECLPSK